VETLFWTICAIVVSKALLKAVAPYKNKALDDKLKEYWKDFKNYLKK